MEYEALKRTGIANLFSTLGRNITLPQGIFYWLGRAKKEAKINATIGSARGPEREIIPGGADEPVTFYLPTVLKCLRELESEAVFPYAPITGLPQLRDAWREWILRKSADRREQVEACLCRPVITPGITGALHVAAKLFVEPGEVVVSPDLLWGNYRNIIERNVGARIETFPFFHDGEFNLTGMKRKLLDTLATQSRAVLVLNFPNNPAGYVPPKASASAIVEALDEVVEEADRPLVVLCDDAYEGYVYEPDALGRSLFADLCDAHPRLLPVKLDGASKEFLFYGGRVGALSLAVSPRVADDREQFQVELDNKLGAVIRSTVSNCPMPVQSALVKALGRLDEVLAERERVIEVLGQRARRLRAELDAAAIPQLRPLPFNSGFFCFCEVEGIRASELADHLMTKYATGVVPTESGKINGIRIAFCSTPEDQIPELVGNLARAAADLA